MKYDIPEVTMGALHRYLDYGVPASHFLAAVLTNDLFGAFQRADEANIKAMYDLVKYIYNELPALCNGTRDRYDGWIRIGGLDGMKRFGKKEDEG
jgi:hypothetical protein